MTFRDLNTRRLGRIVFGLALLMPVMASSQATSPSGAQSLKLQRALENIFRPSNTAASLPNLSARVVSPKRNLNWSTALGAIDGKHGIKAGADNPFRIASVTKTFVAAATMKLIEEHHLALDSPIAPLLSASLTTTLRAGGANPDNITVRQLLAHRSGIFDHVSNQYFAAVKANPQRRWTRQEQLELSLALNTPIEPDTAYIYSDTNYILLGDILEHAAHKPLARVLRQEIGYEKIGLTNTWMESLEPQPTGTAPRLHQYFLGDDVYALDPSYDLWGGGGLVSTTKDLATFFRALFDGRVVSKNSLALMTNSVSGGGFGEEAYGLGIMPFYLGNARCFGHTGINAIIAAHCHEIDLTFVVASGDLLPGIDLDTSRRGPGAQFAQAIGIDTSPQPYGKALRRTACPPEFKHTQNARIHCGMLTVPENYAQPNGRNIELAAVLAQHAYRVPKVEPLLILGGGPGVPLFPTAQALLADGDSAEALLANQNIVLIEQRGVGASVPNLSCQNALRNTTDVDRCLIFLKSNMIDTRQYTSIASANDMELLRRALNIQRWNLEGSSYGTRLALTMLRERPNTIRSMVLDGVDPPETSFSNDPPSLNAALNLVLTRCAADPQCRIAFPNLKARFIETVASLNRMPLMINGNTISGDSLVIALSPFQGSPELLAYQPAVIDAMARRDSEFFSKLLSGSGPDVPAPDNGTSGMFLSVTCSDDAPLLNRIALQQLTHTNDVLLGAFARNAVATLSFCDHWSSGRAPDRVRLPVPVRVPTLAFNAEFDQQTPPDYGRVLAMSQPGARGIEFRGIGHIALTQATACAVPILAKFVSTTDPRSIDTTCASSLPSPAWKSGLDAGFYALLAAQ